MNRTLTLPRAAVALVTAAAGAALLAAPAGAARWTVAGALAAVALAALARRAPRAGAAAEVELERVGGCSLGPGVAVHAVRFEGRVLLLGATASAITVLDGRPADRADDALSLPARLRVPAVVLLAACVALGGAGGARAAQGESAEQRAAFGADAAEPSSAARPAAAPPLRLAPAAGGDPVPRLPATTGTGALVWLAGLALLPFAFMTLTSFVKISVVLSILRTALGTPQIPSDPVLAAIALSLTVFVMTPVASEAAARVEAAGADVSTVGGALAAAAAAAGPVRAFLGRNARPEEVALFVDVATRDGAAPPAPDAFAVLVPAFVTSELRQAFVVGFLVYVPFLVIDLVVANILMSMGMVMVSPAAVSLPFKVMVFVLVDGWPMLMKGLALSYH
jgi:type III secretion apparatus YscR/HrcR family protein